MSGGKAAVSRLGSQAGHPQLAWVRKQGLQRPRHVRMWTPDDASLHLAASAILLASVACETFRTSTVDQDHLFHFYEVPSVGILWSDVTCFLSYTEPPPFKKKL